MPPRSEPPLSSTSERRGGDGPGRRRWRHLRSPRRSELLGGALLLFVVVSAVLLLTDPGDEEPRGPTGVTTAVAATPDAAEGAASPLDPGGAACTAFGRLLTRLWQGANGGDRRALEALAADAASSEPPLDVAGAHLAEAARLAGATIELGRAGERERSAASYQLRQLSEEEAVATARALGCPGERVALPPARSTPLPAISDGDRLIEVLRDTYRSRAAGVEPTDRAARAELYRRLGAVASGMDAAVAETTCTAGFLNGLVDRAATPLEGYVVFASVVDVCIDVGAIDARIGRSEFRGG